VTSATLPLKSDSWRPYLLIFPDATRPLGEIAISRGGNRARSSFRLPLSSNLVCACPINTRLVEREHVEKDHAAAQVALRPRAAGHPAAAPMIAAGFPANG